MKKQAKHLLLTGLMALALAACAAQSTKPSLTITKPANNATVKGPKVLIEVQSNNFALTPAGPDIKDGEGHLHFFVDTPATSVVVGALIPSDQPAVYVHAGKDPLASRELELSKGTHTITVVMGNAAHFRLAQPEPASITIVVE